MHKWVRYCRHNLAPFKLQNHSKSLKMIYKLILNEFPML
ncbi:hypothetical protein AB89_4633 [Escherichia coli 2-316-03_S3_C1]|nr:hypothetical protein AB89_4633 [Escherichia coli 2-316-03_S3_C1]